MGMSVNGNVNADAERMFESDGNGSVNAAVTEKVNGWIKLKCYRCGHPAFEIWRPAFIRHAIVHAADARHLDGSPMEAYTAIRCDSCGRSLIPQHLKEYRDEQADEQGT